MKQGKLILLSLLFVQITGKIHAQFLVPDLNFGSSGIVHHIQTFSYCAIGDASGNYYVGGPSFYSVNADFAVTKLLNDGSLDSSFGVNGIAFFDAGFTQQHLNDLAIQSDGKIVFVGGLYNGSNWDGIAGRLTADGQLDSTFNGIGYTIINVNAQYDNLSSVVIQNDSKIVCGGTTCFGNQFDYKLAAWRFNTNGTPDATFALNGMFRYTSNGGALKVIMDGNKIVLGGYIDDPNQNYAIIRLDASGVPDPPFGNWGVFLYATGGNGIIRDLIMDGSKYIAVTESFQGNPTLVDWEPEIFRVSSNGILEISAFGGGVTTLSFSNYSVISNSIIKSGNSIIVGGFGFNTGGFGNVNAYDGVFYQVDISTGTLNTSNGVNGLVKYGIAGAREVIQYVHEEPSGKIVFIGGEGSTGNFMSKYVFTSVGVAETESQQLTLFPNPANDHISFVVNNENFETLEIRDLLGRLYMTSDVHTGSNQIALTNLSDGIYIVNILDTNGTKRFASKLVVK